MRSSATVWFKLGKIAKDVIIFFNIYFYYLYCFYSMFFCRESNRGFRGFGRWAMGAVMHV